MSRETKMSNVILTFLLSCLFVTLTLWCKTSTGCNTGTVIDDDSLTDENIFLATEEQTEAGIEQETNVPTSFSFTQCGDDPMMLPIQFKRFSINPDPLILPGVLQIKVSLKVKEEVTGPIKASLRMEKHFPDGWFTLPCNDQGYGSCEYQDVCPYFYAIAPLCPKSVKESGNNCTCPLQPGKYSFKTLKLPVMVPFEKGPFHLVAKFTSEEGRLVACLDTSVIFQEGDSLDVDQDHVHP